ncbi:ABC transporter ATP-binding protein [Chitinophaga eiseniae]|uniref:ABC transporter ATP-binding protein n=1 Tax=Chitinophaga eiseniae TaxID=634771 RepID=A0A847SH06_9BACT|nr:ABC transporter ATP-binding protein [Chitinophaga eiseniae]NLR78077.1 ABC transporter ATP-binding protein [Chitinophaga eiseniae]
MNKIIIVDDLVKEYGSKTVVRNISFNITSGSIYGLLGANGAGKTTVIKMIIGLVQPTSGSIYIDGINAKLGKNNGTDFKSKIGYMGQQFNLYNQLTVRQNLMLHAGCHYIGRRNGNIRIEELITDFQLSDIIDVSTAKLSAGQQQKIAFACSIIHRPKIVVVDEPTNQSDQNSKRIFWEQITSLSKQSGITFLVTTHNLFEAEYCNYISIMDGGIIKEAGTPSGIKSKYNADSLTEAFRRIVKNNK